MSRLSLIDQLAINLGSYKIRQAMLTWHQQKDIAMFVQVEVLDLNDPPMLLKERSNVVPLEEILFKLGGTRF